MNYFIVREEDGWFFISSVGVLDGRSSSISMLSLEDVRLCFDLREFFLGVGFLVESSRDCLFMELCDPSRINILSGLEGGIWALDFFGLVSVRLWGFVCAVAEGDLPLDGYFDFWSFDEGLVSPTLEVEGWGCLRREGEGWEGGMRGTWKGNSGV